MKIKLAYRVVTFVPPDRVEDVIQGVIKVAPLRYGQYEHVLWRSAPGRGQNRPVTGARPRAGEVGTLFEGDSTRLEFSIPRDKNLMERVLSEGVLAVHPYEEPVVLVYEVLETRAQFDEEVGEVENP